MEAEEIPVEKIWLYAGEYTHGVTVLYNKHLKYLLVDDRVIPIGRVTIMRNDIYGPLLSVLVESELRENKLEPTVRNVMKIIESNEKLKEELIDLARSTAVNLTGCSFNTVNFGFDDEYAIVELFDDTYECSDVLVVVIPFIQPPLERVGFVLDVYEDNRGF